LHIFVTNLVTNFERFKTLLLRSGTDFKFLRTHIRVLAHPSGNKETRTLEEKHELCNATQTQKINNIMEGMSA